MDGNGFAPAPSSSCEPSSNHAPDPAIIRKVSERTSRLVASSKRLDPARIMLHDETDFDDRTHYEITEEALDTLKKATIELHNMALHCVELALSSDAILNDLKVPVSQWEPMRDSWNRGDKGLFGRMDLAWDAAAAAEPNGQWTPKLLEYNADTPGCFYETGMMQAEYGFLAGRRTAGDDFERLVVQALQRRRFPTPVGVMYHPGDNYIASVGSYLAEIFEKSGYDVRKLEYPDVQEPEVASVYKLFRWHAIWADKFPPVQRIISAMEGPIVLEPPWKCLMQNKGLMALMWQQFPDCPFLLPTYLNSPHRIPSVEKDGYILKSFHGVCGSEVRIIPPGSSTAPVLDRMESPCIFQKLVNLPQYDGRYPIASTWVVDDEYAGALIRDDTNRISNNDVVVPLVIQEKIQHLQ